MKAYVRWNNNESLLTLLRLDTKIIVVQILKLETYKKI